MQTLPFWEADLFCRGTKAGKNVHVAVIRIAKLEFDEQTYLSLEIYTCIFGYMIQPFDLH